LRIIAKSRLIKYWETAGNEQSRTHLNEWYHFCLEQNWKTPQDIKNTLCHASILKNNRVVFNVNGNHYRIVCSIFYPAQIMYIKFVGTHTEYDQIDVNTIE
jgi:mRNA interferase HigB